MRLILTLIVLFATIALQAQQSSANQPGKSNGRLKFSLTLGPRFSLVKGTLVHHLKKEDFLIEHIHIYVAPTDTPKGGIPIFADLSFDYRRKGLVAVGLTGGIGQLNNVGGRLKSAYHISINYKHSSWFVAPTVSKFFRDTESSKIFIGPSVEFHTLSITGSRIPTHKQRPITIGAMTGMKLTIMKSTDLSFAFLWSPKLTYNKLTIVDDQDEIILPAVQVGFSHLRIGLSFALN